MRIKKEKDFISCFNEKTGRYIRTGILETDENGRRRDTGIDPFMASFPELLDVGIMGHCKHGETGLCVKAGIGCYQDGLHSNKDNMSYKDFENIVDQCKGKTFQIALGGCGDPDQHEQFEDILRSCKAAGIVPNFTTSGYGMTEDIAKLCKRYCGAVAVSWYRSEYTLRAIDMLVTAGVKTNIHYVLSKSSIHEAIYRLKKSSKYSVNASEDNRNDKHNIDNRYYGDTDEEYSSFPNNINAIIFLLYKPVGLGTKEEMITANNKEFQELIEYIDEHSFPFKIGFDSCTVPALLGMSNVDYDSMDTCEGGRWSAYISADMKMMPCSFDNQYGKWAVDLRKNTIKEVWDSEVFENFRNYFVKSCPECEKHTACLGGCPIVPEIVLCSYKQRKKKY